MTWTRFADMHSGGGRKLDYGHIYVNLSKEYAETWFAKTFKRDPRNVTCECCGPDYTIREYDSVEEATAFDRGCSYDRDTGATIEGQGNMSFGTYRPLEQYELEPGVLIVREVK